MIRSSDLSVEMAQYRLILILPHSREVLVMDASGRYLLPEVSIPDQLRPAQALHTAVRESWNMVAIILELLPSSGGVPACALAEVLSSNPSSTLKAIKFAQLHKSALSDGQRYRIESALSDDAKPDNPFARIGWIDEAIAWLESSTRERITSKQDIEQYQAGGTSALVRFSVEDGAGYWLKATGKPNLHERTVTEYLHNLCPGHLPRLVSSSPEWNAWIMAEEGRPLSGGLMTPFQVFLELEQAVLSIANVQYLAAGQSLDLLDAGAFDQGMGVLEEHTAELFEYLEEATSHGTEVKAWRLTKKRLIQLRKTYEEVCYRMEDLGLGETIVHGALNWSNILTGSGTSQFIDWSEAYLGHPFIALQHLLNLNNVENSEVRDLIHRVLREKYRDHWAMYYASEWVEEGLVYMPLLTVGSSLYGRGDWLRSPERNEPRRLAYARTLARKMDRAARQPELQELLAS